MRSVVITGASSGIGKACALGLARAGFRVFAGVRKPEDGDRLREEPGAFDLEPLILDLESSEALEAAASRVADVVGEQGLGGLVNNAGVAIPGPLEFLPLDRLRKQFEVNVFGQIAAIQAFLPLIRKARGRVVNIGSMGGVVSQPFNGPYCASKFAMEALSDALRGELAPWGIHVALVQPGSIATPIWDKARADSGSWREKFPEEAATLYSNVLDKSETIVAATADRGIPPEQVFKAVHHALTAGVPRTRYQVGLDAQLALMVRLVPDRLRDGLLARYMGL